LDSGEILVGGGTITVSAATPEPEFETCPGNCLFVWDPEQDLWLLYGSTCSCNCYPPEGDGPEDESITREGTCGETQYELPNKEWGEPQWPSPVVPQVPVTTTADCSYDSGEYPNGICLYRCTGGIYSRLCKNCTVDKDCPEVYIDALSPFCEDGEYMTLGCS